MHSHTSTTAILQARLQASQGLTNTPQELLSKKDANKKQNIDEAMNLVREGADSNAANHHGETLLHMLVAGNRKGIFDHYIKELVKEHKADINICDTANR